MLDDDSDSSASEVDDDFDNDPLAREERALFEDPYQRKRRRRNGKQDALYGIFGEESDGENAGKKGGGGAKKSDWTKAPAFVSGEKKVDLDQEMGIDLDAISDDDEAANGEDVGSEGEDEVGEEEYSDNSEPSRPPSPRIHEEDEESEKPRVGGIGLGAAKPDVLFPFSSRGGIGSSKISHSATDEVLNSFGAPSSSQAGIGSSPTASTSYTAEEELPSSFRNRSQRSFIRDANPSPKVPMSTAEMAHFNKLQGSFGARMLSKMGWQAGTGLGTTGEGIVTPIESKMRPQKMGIAFKGFKEKTEQSKMEARRRGEVVSDDEDVKAKKFRKKVKEQEEKRSDVWKRSKKVKTKVEHKTYEQIVAEAGEEVPAAGIGQIIDATGAIPREVSSLADVSLNSWSPSNDPTRIPEVRHNIRLIADVCKSDLDNLAREAKALAERKKWITTEDARLRKKVEDEAELIARLQKLQLVANDISTTAKNLASVYEVSLEPFSPLFHLLVDQYPREFEKYRLDEIAVAAIAPSVRRMVASWNPLEDPTAFVPTFRTWRRALRVSTHEEKPSSTEVDVYGSQTIPVEVENPMTPFESLLWNVWLPRVRTCINNDWSPDYPSPAVKLYEAWSTFLPPFIRDNLLDQLILPKVKQAIADWSPRRDAVTLQTIVFPWLPCVGLRLEDMVGDARRKLKSLLRSWMVGDAIPTDLAAWKDIFDVSEWDAMLLKYIVPKLGGTLRDDFRVNPRDQKMQPLEHVLQWSDFIRSSIFSQILETEFFPKWLDVLHVWLIQPRVSFEEVAQWYSFWKGIFPEKVQIMSGVSRGFTRGLQLMNKAIELGPDAPSQLPRPDFHADESAPSAPVRNGAKMATKSRPSARTQEITFKSIVEDFAASHNLLFIPTGRAHEKSRMPLYRVSMTADGKGGLLVYILDDAIWAPQLDGEDYRAISLENMILRATDRKSVV